MQLGIEFGGRTTHQLVQAGGQYAGARAEREFEIGELRETQLVGSPRQLEARPCAATGPTADGTL
ncbi:MAG: hypothetical protein IPG43_21170 [Proteobacteria bacterium]|nr:hypothetical protein [Pseudomonadota bacterium]